MADVKDQPPAREQGEHPAPLSEPPPKYIRPGDNPELDALVAELRKDSEDGDPLWRPKSWSASRGAEPRAAAAPEGNARTDKGAEPASLGALAVDRRMARKRLRSRWVLLAVVAMVMPVLALALGVVLKYQGSRMPEMTPAQATVAAPATKATPAASIPSLANSTTAPPPHLDQPSPGPRASSVRPAAPGGRSVPAPRPPTPRTVPEGKTPAPQTNPPDDPGLFE